MKWYLIVLTIDGEVFAQVNVFLRSYKARQINHRLMPTELNVNTLNAGINEYDFDSEARKYSCLPAPTVNKMFITPSRRREGWVLGRGLAIANDFSGF